ncbi:PREDICTED: UDP-glucuronosyltransferase 2B17-like [Dinoponera quadriceps]|uniref:UDP-glucuronosyltransferase 2B17-like n=1 Tax=Dinoponera quadriceps TaxID=609295 RepID=A0A6P3XWH0_DINQU|nr:PREDICTED: UDP-glucuronosyltransferase 2B17-like [Dinoponera quadriceps]
MVVRGIPEIVQTIRRIYYTCSLAIYYVLGTSVTESWRILVVAPTPSFSHQIVFRSLCRALHKRGHEIVTITSIPMRNSSLLNYTEIDISSLYQKAVDWQMIRTWQNSNQLTFKRYICKSLNIMIEEIFKNPDVRMLYTNDSNESFDVVMVEMIASPAMNILGYVFNAPVIGVSTLELHYHHQYIIGNPLLPSHVSTWDTSVTNSDGMSFWQKTQNFLYVWFSVYEWNAVLTSARPDLPNVIYFDSIHVEQTPPILPQNLKMFLDDATDGFIYVSFGGNIDITDEIKRSLVELTSNVFTAEWLPQQGILAHPKIRAFVYHGGLQSTEEAVHYAVPLIGIPFQFDQNYRVCYLTSLGVAKHLDIFTCSKEDIDNVIRDLLSDMRYKDNMLKLRARANDRPYDSLGKAIWWVEFVIRHKGAAYLRFNGNDES